MTFREFARQLQPNIGYMRLYQEIVIDVWRKKQGIAKRCRASLPARLKNRENKTKLEAAFVYQKAIEEETYQQMRAKLIEDLTLAEMELREAPGGRDRNRDGSGICGDGSDNASNL
jgi:hypothetical protein